MPTTRHAPRLRTLPVLPLLLAAACTHGGGGGAGGGEDVRSTYVPVECGRGNGETRRAEIGEAGGRVEVEGHSLLVPPQAVSGRTPFTITEQPAGYIGVEVGPHGTRFGRNATLTLSFARCGGFPAGYRDLRILPVIAGTAGRLGPPLPTVVDLNARTVSTPGLEHLSGYLIGGNRTEGS